MRMSTTKLVLLRLYLVTLGRVQPFSHLLKRIMVRFLIEQSADPHVPSSRFFTPDQLCEHDK